MRLPNDACQFRGLLIVGRHRLDKELVEQVDAGFRGRVVLDESSGFDDSLRRHHLAGLQTKGSHQLISL